MSKENLKALFATKSIDKDNKRKESKEEEIKRENFVFIFYSKKNKTISHKDEEKKKDEMDNDYTIELKSSGENKNLFKNDIIEIVIEVENNIPENRNNPNF